MNNFEKFLQIIGNITFSVFIIYIAHEAIHLTMTKNLIATVVSKQLYSQKNKTAITNIFSSVFEEKLNTFHNHLNDNEMTLLSTIIFETISKNNLEHLTPEEIAFWRKKVNEWEEENKRKRAAEKEKADQDLKENYDEFITKIESIDPDMQQRNPNLKLMKP